MHENKFELQVGELMDQLGFDPPDSLWAELDRKINEDKKKRRPLLWIFLFSGLVLAGGGIFLAKQEKFAGILQIREPEFFISKNPQSPQKKRTEVRKISVQDAVQYDDTSSSALYRSAGNKGVGALRGNHPFHIIPRLPQVPESGMTTQQKTQSASFGETVYGPEKGKAERSHNDQHKLISSDSSALVNGKAVQVAQSLTIDSVSGLKAGKNEIHSTKNSPWTIGFTGSVGLSNVNQRLFQPVNAMGFSYLPANSNAAAGSRTGASANYAEIHAGFSFSLGVLVNRKLSKRTSLSAGLGYRYFSSKINTGVQVDSLLNALTLSGQYASVSSFYRNGTGLVHTNSYHFIELPVDLNLQINRSIRTPVIWQAGFSLAWMISSNTLLYDPYTNVYFVSNPSLKTVQWNAATAIMVGFPLKNHAFQLGPQLQYGLTGLSNTRANNPGHLFFFGLKMTFIP